MPEEFAFLADYIRPDTSVARSINIERDNKAVSLLHKYSLGPAGKQVLSRFAAALHGEKVNAWSLTGPYGMGKSALVNFLVALSGPAHSEQTRVALYRLSKADAALATELRDGIERLSRKAGFFPVAVTAGYEPLCATLRRGLKRVATQGETRAGPEESNGSPAPVGDEPRVTLDAFQRLLQQTGRPILLVIDEFGKSLEYLSHHPGRGDLFILQQLAETPGMFILVCLHQAFEEYASALSVAQRQEWAKIQGRFEDISFVENNDHLLLLMQRVRDKKLPPWLEAKVRQWAQEAVRQAQQLNLSQPALRDEATVFRLYPLLPVTALALAELCRRFAQYNRTLFCFLSSGHHLALPAYLSKTPLPPRGPLPAAGLDLLYDYFLQTGAVPYFSRPEAQRWLEIQDIISTSGDLPDLEMCLLKTIGVLNLLGGGAVCPASPGAIASIIELSGRAGAAEVQQVLAELTRSGKLLYRGYASEYRLWEGTDFDINTALQKQKERLILQPLDQLLNHYTPQPPLVAARHALEKGTVRRFERRWMDAAAVSEELAPTASYDGLFLYCYGLSESPPAVPAKCRDGRPLMVAYAPVESALKEKALEIGALQALLREKEELMHDGVARREIKYRLKVAEAAFRTLVSRAYTPGSPYVRWISGGRSVAVGSSRDLGSELSRLCDEEYCKCPKINNEMINHDRLSSAVASARRTLVEAMAEKAGLEDLGFTGFGPEVALYRSLLLATGLHIPAPAQNSWQLTLPGSDPSLYPLWHKFDELVSSKPEGISVTAIMDELQKPPFGLRLGPAAVFVCHYLLVKADEVVVFQENVYRPYLNGATLALLIKRPDLFFLKKVGVNEMQHSALLAYRKILRHISLVGTKELRNQSLLRIVAPLVKFADSLSPYARHTRRVSPAARRVLLALQNATDPLRLLLEELPAALQVDLRDREAQPEKELQRRLTEVLQELREADQRLQSKVENILLQTWRAKNLEELYSIMKEKAGDLANFCSDPEVKPLLKSMARPAETPAQWARGIAGSIIKKPLESWHDQDFPIFVEKVQNLAVHVEELELLRAAGGGCCLPGQVLLTLTTSGGQRRHIMTGVARDDAEVRRHVAAIAALPPEKARAVLVALAEYLLKAKGGG